MGIIGADSKDGDFIEQLHIGSNHDYLLFFTDRGKLYWLKVYFLPELSRQSKGRAVVNLLNLGRTERITSVVPVRDSPSATGESPIGASRSRSSPPSANDMA